MDDELFADQFLRAEGLPTGFRREVERLWRPLAERVLARAQPARMLVVGLCGPQGSGKSTGAMALERLLIARGRRVARLSIDDLYLSRVERRRLAAEVHPLLATRGPPGTHDPELGVHLLRAMARSGAIRLPRFDKAIDDRTKEAEWPVVQGPVEVAILEGWCVGARPQSAEALEPPINALEAIEDAEGVWRRYVNDALAGRYQTLFARIDMTVLLRAPSFETILGWRLEQERKLRARVGARAEVMSDAEVERFIQHYERLTRWIDAEMPARADLTVQLDEARSLAAIRQVD